jgi:hypothetical protein
MVKPLLVKTFDFPKYPYKKNKSAKIAGQHMEYGKQLENY